MSLKSARVIPVYKNGKRTDMLQLYNDTIIAQLSIQPVIDLPNCLQNCAVSLYADDTCIYYASNILQDIENHLNQDLQNISDWLSCTRLALNTKKCETMLIGSKKRIFGKNLDLFIDNIKLNQVTVYKYLWVYIDNSLEWDKHVKKNCVKVLWKICIC